MRCQAFYVEEAGGGGFRRDASAEADPAQTRAGEEAPGEQICAGLQAAEELKPHHTALRLVRAERFGGERCTGLEQGFAPALDLDAALHILERQQ